jgi:hypothetical protein
MINTHGHLRYRIQDYSDEGKYKIYFHNGPDGDPQLLSSTANWPGNVQLNEEGQMAWTGYDAALDLQVYFFSNGTTTPITTYRSPSSMADNVSLNNHGQLVWVDITQAGSEYSSNIRHYENGIITGLYSTSKNFFGSQFQINNLGQIVWAESNGSAIDVMLYDGGNVHALPGGEGFSQLTSLQINHQGQIMWLGLKAGTEYDIYLYSKGVTSKITNYENYAPGTVDIWQNSPTDVKTKFSLRMNNKGDIVWVTRVANPANAYDWVTPSPTADDR